MLQVNLLGNFKLISDGVALHLDLGASGRAMAGYIFAFPGKYLRRDRIASMFWPELDSAHSRGALNSAIWRLRKALAQTPEGHLDEVLRTQGEDVFLETRSWMTIDKFRFEERLSPFLFTVEVQNNECNRDELGETLELYAGPFLDCEGCAWVLEERERLNILFTRGARLLTRWLAQTGEYSKAIGIARRLVAEDNFRELIVRELIGLLALDEQRPEALRFYKNWSTMLGSELDVAPMPATQSLVQQVRDAQSADDFRDIRDSLFSAQVQ